MNWDDVWVWLANFSAGATILGFALVAWQQIKQTQAAEEDIRAFIHLDLKKTKVSNKSASMLALVIYNSGEVSAEELSISAKQGIQWFALNGDFPPEFTKPNSKLRVLPGEELEFLLGPVSLLEDSFKSEVKLTLTYKALPTSKKIFRDEQILSTTPMRYLLKRQIH